MRTKGNIKIPIFLVILGAIAAGCSVDRNNIFSKTYHNITARYNAYFIANEHMKDVEETIKDSYDRNFNKILKVFPPVDTTVIATKSTELEECVKKASIAIQRHKNSKWVDDSYILIGKARFYTEEFDDAIETFKYVNVNSEDDNARHLALINLMRTFVDKNEQNNAVYVSDYLKKEELNKENKKKLELVRAHLYQEREDYDNMARHLIEAAPLLKKSDGKSRIFFILGQLYQEIGLEAEAYKYYNQCIKSNPDYELSFYAKLNMAQVTELSDGSDVKKTRKYFRGLLRDRKNEEYKDKIYYEMAQFELKQGNLDDAIDYYKSSVRSSVSNPRQKGYSYLRLGQVYFDSLQQYELAKSYYDSVVTVLPQDDDLFVKVKERQEILSDFVDQINTIHTQDSLLQLASMDSAQLMTFIDEHIQQKEKEAQERLAQEERERRRGGGINNFGADSNELLAINSQGEGSQWYFYSPSSISVGRSEFLRQWGSRPLEDNWRRSRKERSGVAAAGANPAEATEQTAGTPAGEGSLSGLNRDELYASVPTTPDQKQMALTLIENAYYRLGNIYNFNLYEKASAAETFLTLIERFPDSDYEPEVLYLLHLIYKELEDGKSAGYKDELIAKHPNTIYAKMLINPNYKEESNAVVEVLKKMYDKAYRYFQMDSVDQALAIVEDGLRKYPDNTFSDNLQLLKVLIIGKTEGVYNYQYALQQFIEKYPDSDVNDYAAQLLQAIDNYKADLLRREGVNYRSDLDQSHYFALVYRLGDHIAERLISRVNEFVKAYGEEGLRNSNMILDEERSIILVSDFDTKEAAMTFYTRFNENPETLGELKNYNINNFVITKDNFQTLYSTKGLDYYVAFFNKNYQ